MKRILVLIILCLPLWSCATYYATREDVVGQVREWEQTGDYGKIFDTLEKINPKHPQYRQLQRMKPRLQEDARKYQKDIATTALSLAQKQQWQKALQTFDEGLDKYPQSSFLEREREKFLQDREQFLDYLERKYLYERAEWLIKAIPKQQQIVDTNPGDRTQSSRLKKLQKLSEETAEQLGQYGMAAYKADQRGVARRSLSLANTLQPNEEYSRILKQVELSKQRNSSRKPAQRSTSPTYSSTVKEVQKQELDRLFDYFEQAYARQDWLEAEDYLKEIESLEPRSKRTQEARSKLDASKADYVQQQIKLGEHQYSQGDFTVALETWEAVYPLAPDNKALNKYIRRANRVLESLKELSGRPPAIRFPVEDESPAPTN